MTTLPDNNELAVKARLIALIDGPNTAAAQPDTNAVHAAAPAAAANAQPPAAAQLQPGNASAPGDGWWDALYADDSTPRAVDPETDAQPRIRDRRRIQPWWSGRSVDLGPLDKEEPGEEDGIDDGADAQSDADYTPDADADGTAEPDQDTDAKPKRVRPKLRIPTLLSRPDSPASAVGAIIAAPAPRMSLLEAAANVPRRFRWLILHASAAAAGYHYGWVQYSTRTASWIADHGILNISATFWIGCGIGCEYLRHRMRNHRLPIRWLAAVPISSIVVGTLLYGTGWQNLELPL